MNSLDKYQQITNSFIHSLSTTNNKMNNFMAIFKIHGADAIQIWSSESLIGGQIIQESALGNWGSCSSLSNRSAATTSAAPSRASTICSEDETDEDYFSGTDTSIGGVSVPSRIRYTIKQVVKQQTEHDCYNQQSDVMPESNLEVITLEQPSKDIKSCTFKPQTNHGQVFKSTDMVILRSQTFEGSKSINYEVTLSHGSMAKKIGVAYLTLDPKRSTQGVARAHISNGITPMPIGQVQFEFLLISNPVAYKLPSPQPKWLNTVSQLDAGHRGAGSGCRIDLPMNIVENTVASFNYAARNGADMCELDVFVSADGIPVVYHDFDADVGKANKIQVSEYTLKDLREFTNLSIHDDGKNFEVDVLKQCEENRPFPTLEEVLKYVDSSCALNIEIKWPQLMENGKLQGLRNREVNDFVGIILDCILAHHNGRAIILSTFDADIAIMLRLKQTEFPVLFLTTGDSQRFTDPRTKTVKNGIHFAQAFNLAGINPRSDHINQSLVRYAKERGLLVYSWGNEINSAQAIRELKRIGLNGVIYDKIDLIKPKD